MESKYFLIKQLVPPDVYAARGDTAWELFAPELITTIDQVYEYFGRYTINNWHTGGKFKESGYRSPDSKTGAPKSQHKKGRAVDAKPLDVSPQFMYAEILKNPKAFPLLTTLEDISYTSAGAGWVHVDVRPSVAPGVIRVIKP